MTRALRSSSLSIVMALVFVFVAKGAIGQALATATGPGPSIMAGGGVALFYSPYGQRELGGALVFADLQPHWRLGVETEARYLRLHTSEDVSEKNYLLGPRVLLHAGRWQPYAKFLAGDGHIEMPFHYARGDFLALVPGGGLDLAVNNYVNIRAVDVEYQLWRQFPYGNMRPFGIGAGVSVRLTPIVRFPSDLRLRH